MPRRSKAWLMRARRSRLPSSYHESSRTATFTADQGDMADKVTPYSGAVRPEATNLADRRQRSERATIAWRTQIFERIVEPTDDIQDFFTEFAPSTQLSIPACPDESFQAHVPTGKGKEPRMYKPLIEGLQSLVRNFEVNKQPQFHNHAHNIMQFPFALYDDEEHATMPDIIATLPELPCLPPLHRWRNIALVFEAKAREAEDPMEKYTEAHEETLIQLAKSARNIMLAQGRLYAFVVGIYGRLARIFRFDRAGAVCSPSFDYMSEPNVLHEFLWRFLHPDTRECSVLGDDPTSSLGTRDDMTKVQEFARKYDPSYNLTAEGRKAIRRFTLTRNTSGDTTTYLAYKLIFANPRLFSRATTIWEAFELNEKDEATGKRVVIKEAWRQFVRPSEIRHYCDMQEAADKAGEDVALSLAGIAEFDYGDDLGLRETKALVEEAARAMPGLGNSRQAPEGPPSLVDDDTFPELTVPSSRVLGHRTVSARCRNGGAEDHERTQVRLVLKTIGVPITEFESTYEMVRALRDAIEGHRQAYLAGIIHRDVSRGNVMIIRNADGSSGGFIHDFDYASSWKRFLAEDKKPNSLESWEEYTREEYKRDLKKDEQDMEASDTEDSDSDASNGDASESGSGQTRRSTKTSQKEDSPHTPGGSKDEQCGVNNPKNDQKQRTGTLHFMAVEVLNEHFKVTHEARHDLESFYWLLVWIVLRHTVYHTVRWNPDRTWHELFDAGKTVECRSLKVSWLNDSLRPVKVKHNKPLSQLLEDFRQLCLKNFGDRFQPEQPMTHQDVLEIFNRALENRDAWPKGDRAKPWSPPKEPLTGIEKRSGQLRSKGTLTYTSQGHSRGGSRHDVLPTLIVCPESSPSASDAYAQSGGGHTPSDYDVDIPETGAGKGNARSKAVARQARRPVRRTIAMTSASGSDEAPPSSDSGSLQVPSSGYALRSAKNKHAEELRQSASSTSCNMARLPVPETRSAGSQGRSSRQPTSSSRATSGRGSSATKRNRTRGQEMEDEAGASSSKRQRTLSEPRSTKRSRKPRGKR